MIEELKRLYDDYRQESDLAEKDGDPRRREFYAGKAAGIKEADTIIQLELELDNKKSKNEI